MPTETVCPITGGFVRKGVARIRDNNQKSIAPAVIAIIGGAICSIWLVRNIGASHETSVLFLIIYLIMIIAACIASVCAVNFAQPFFSCRNAARRALGKHSIEKLTHDRNARLVYKGLVAFFGGKAARAEKYLNEALEQADVRENKFFCVQWLISVYKELENDEKQIWCMRKAVEYMPERPEVQIQLGRAYFVTGQLDKALYCFEQALRYDPNNGYCYYSIARIYMIRREYDKADETIATLLKINENHPLVYAELAELCAVRGDSEGAEENFQKALLCGYEEAKELNELITNILRFGVPEDEEPPTGDNAVIYEEKQNAAGEGGTADARNE